MPRTIESSGDIETVCKQDPIQVGDLVKLVFQADDEIAPPFNLRIKSPAGGVIVEKVLRELPTGRPQSAPPIEFTVSAVGEYKLEIKQLYGKQKGEALIRVTP